MPMPTSMNGCIQLTLHSNYFATQLIATLPVMCGPKKSGNDIVSRSYVLKEGVESWNPPCLIMG